MLKLDISTYLNIPVVNEFLLRKKTQFLIFCHLPPLHLLQKRYYQLFWITVKTELWLNFAFLPFSNNISTRLRVAVALWACEKIKQLQHAFKSIKNTRDKCLNYAFTNATAKQTRCCALWVMSSRKNFYINIYVCIWFFIVIRTFPQLMYSTAVSRKKKYTKSPCVKELTKFGAAKK